MTNRAYYKKELNRIDINQSATVQFYGNNCDIKSLNINLESIKEIKNFLNRVERQLIKEQIKQNNIKLKDT